jgi:hypothetical protein
LENIFFKPRTVLGREPARVTARATQRPATRGRPKSHVGLGLAAHSSRGSGPRRGDGARAPGALMAWSPRTVCALDGVVARSAMTQWRLAGGKVLPASTGEVLGRCRAGSWGTKLTRKGSSVARWLSEATVFQWWGAPTLVGDGSGCSCNSKDEGRGEAAR